MKKPFIGVAVGLIAASGASAAMAAVPGVTSEASAPPKVKPATLVYTGDGSAFFAGANKVKGNFGSLLWSKWNKKKALGSGGNWLNDCKPSCAKGHFHGYAVTLKLTTPKTIEGLRVFTRMAVTYTSNVPPHAVRSTIWTLTHSGKLFFWHWPSNAL
jgi:hypothetical protein